jgi:RND superfamily putative drug exporter
VLVFPRSSPQDIATNELVNRLRDHTIPDTLAGTGVVAHMSGPTATFIDMGSVLSSRLPLFIGAVVVVSLLLLVMIFRSVAIPTDCRCHEPAVVRRRCGRGHRDFPARLARQPQAGSHRLTDPGHAVAIIFGLSTDYEMFLVSRVH